MRWKRTLWIACALLLHGCGGMSGTPSQPLVAHAERGRQLYGTYCSACHTTQAHWRDKKVVQSWPDLLREVNRWQGNVGLRWSEGEINDVAAYLNGAFYRLKCPTPGCEGGATTAGL